MNVRFCKILALVDYSQSSLHAAEEAALIASKFDSELQLLHISTNKTSNGGPYVDQPEKQEEQYYAKIDELEKVKNDLHKRYKVSITCFESRGKFIDELKHHVNVYSVELIVLGAKKRSWIRELLIESKARSVIKSVNCEVLCVHSESQTNTLKKIVLPVGKSIPKKKIGIAYELAKKFSAKIYLISLNKSERKSGKEGSEILIASYRYLKDLIDIPIECRTVEGKSIADAAMHYAQIVGADLILIDEGSEFYFKKFSWDRNILTHSMVPVLSVQSANGRSNVNYRA
jgi:nucleotide-binding universal stress UspA family protein